MSDGALTQNKMTFPCNAPTQIVWPRQDSGHQLRPLLMFRSCFARPDQRQIWQCFGTPTTVKRESAFEVQRDGIQS